MYRKAQEHFKKADPILYQASLLHRVANVRRSKSVFRDLVRAVAGQQLSGKAADTIFGRLEKLVGGLFTPEKILLLKTAQLRSCGLSEAKAKTIQGLARAAADKDIDLESIHKLKDAEVLLALTALKGIGPWTAEMILMFSLGRLDIFSKGDLGLRKGMMHLYGLRKMPGERTMDKLSRPWTPYRTYASRILWRVADARKVKEKK